MDPCSLRPAGRVRARTSGHTLLEVAVALTLVGVLLAAVVPPGRGLADAMAVRGAREAVAALAERARAEARRHGGARLRLDAGEGTVRLLVRGVEVERVDLVREWGARLGIGGGRDSAELYWDALGLGRVASLTVEVERRGRTAGLVFSSYGRVRRR